MTTEQIDNPWLALPDKPPFVLAEDAPAIARFNGQVVSHRRYDLSLYPEPFFGPPDAPVVLLALNPGRSQEDAFTHAQPEFAKQALRSLAHQLEPYPFLHLQPDVSTAGSRWWRRITRPLVDELQFDVVAKNILCVQYFPYHSPRFSSPRLMVPSQAYGFQLVRDAIARDAEIVVMRSWKLWSAAVPQLVGYPRLRTIRNPRNPTLSRKNLNGFGCVLKRLRTIEQP